MKFSSSLLLPFDENLSPLKIVTKMHRKKYELYSAGLAFTRILSMLMFPIGVNQQLLHIQLDSPARLQ